jgi:L-threonine kinase
MTADNFVDRQVKSNIVAIPCTCGELFQGTVDGEPCLVSCPIDIFSVGKCYMEERDTPVFNSPKTVRATEILNDRTGRKINTEVKNPLPVGRGYGTSTADIGAALFSADGAFGLNLTPLEAARIAVQVEPTDSTFFAGLTLFDHRAGRFYQSLGDAPRARLIILDPGGMVDSEAFNACDWRTSLQKLAKDHQHAFELLQQGIAAGDLRMIGAAATLSASLHQAILYNPLVELALSFVNKVGAAGICRAHSGTIVGLIFPEDYDLDAAVKTISHLIPGSVHLKEALLVGGGPTTCTASKDVEW